MNFPHKIKNSPSILKDERSSIQNTVKIDKDKQLCPICHQHSNLICYGCCYEFSCQSCFTSEHYSKCNKKFNQYKITLTDAVHFEEQGKLKKYGKKNKQVNQCQRCLQGCQTYQHCARCKIDLCTRCSEQIHSYGKFRYHIRSGISSSPVAYKKMETFLTEQDQVQELVMKKSTKQNIDKGQYGLKPKQKVNKVNSTPCQNKKGKSVMKNSNKNQQNTTIASTVGRQKNQHQISIEAQIISNNIPSNPKINEHSWQLCHNHNKMRTILTETYDLICVECYDRIKSQVCKIKTIDISAWINKQVNIQQVKLHFQTLLNEFNIKIKQTQLQFGNYRQILLAQFAKKQEILVQRYKNNLNCVQKWQNLYKDNIKRIINLCKNSLDQRNMITQAQLDAKCQKKLQKIMNFKNFLALQEINQYKRQYYQQQEQYQFRLNQINSEYYQDMVKNFSFARRKIDDGQGNSHQKSLTKMHQSNQLRQSRISNSSFRTDRKTLNRDESFHKSNYCQLSNNSNLIKRSMSKEIKQDISKDISQKILFSNDNMVKSDKKNSLNSQNVKRFQKQMKNSQYFFQNVPDQAEKSKVKIKKQPIQLTNYSFKDVKYVNLQNFLTQKLDKIYDQRKQKVPLKIDEKANLFSNNMQISTQLVDLHQQQSKIPTSDSRMTYSIDITNNNPSNFIKIPDQMSNNNSLASSAQNSLHNTVTNKNKRKSDYMQMRDRLRKPNTLHKISK